LPCIAAKGLTFKVKGKVIVEDVSAELCGGLNVVLGPNGAGKTTLLRLFAGVLRPTRGPCSLTARPQIRSGPASHMCLPSFPWTP